MSPNFIIGILGSNLEGFRIFILHLKQIHSTYEAGWIVWFLVFFRMVGYSLNWEFLTNLSLLKS
jgi:hypothetical protein